jgi:hypothetical protein
LLVLLAAGTVSAQAPRLQDAIIGLGFSDMPWGSSYLISPTRVHTAAHVVRGTRVWADGAPAVRECYHVSTDSARMTVTPARGRWVLPLADDRGLQEGDLVLLAGYPQRTYREVPGVFLGRVPPFALWDAAMETFVEVGPGIAIAVPRGTYSGMSGGPVLRPSGVVGTVVGYGEREGSEVGWIIAVPSSVARCLE